MSTGSLGTAAQEALMSVLDDDNVEIEIVHRGVGWMQEARDALARRAREQRGPIGQLTTGINRHAENRCKAELWIRVASV